MKKDFTTREEKKKIRESESQGFWQADEGLGANPSGPLPLVGGEVLGSYRTTIALGRFIAFPPKLARNIGMEEAVFLMNLVYAASPEDPWVKRSSEELELETTLTYKQQIRIRASLVRTGLLEEKSNRRNHEMYFRVVEDTFDQMIENLKRNLVETPFGSNSTLPKVSSTNFQNVSSLTLPKGSSLIKQEEVQEEKQEKQPSLLDEGKDWKKIKEENERLEIAKEERRLRKQARANGNFVKPASRSNAPAKIVTNKQPESWLWFATAFKRLADVNAYSHPDLWSMVDEMLSEIDAEEAERRLSEFIDGAAKISGFLAKDFLVGGWRTVGAEEDADSEYLRLDRVKRRGE